MQCTEILTTRCYHIINTSFSKGIKVKVTIEFFNVLFLVGSGQILFSTFIYQMTLLMGLG